MHENRVVEVVRKCVCSANAITETCNWNYWGCIKWVADDYWCKKISGTTFCKNAVFHTHA